MSLAITNDYFCDGYPPTVTSPDRACGWAGGGAPRRFVIAGCMAALSFGGTGVFLDSANPVSDVIEMNWTGSIASAVDESVAAQLEHLREKAGASSWSEVGDWFGVSRRAVHYWTEGGDMSAANRDRLDYLWREAHRPGASSESLAAAIRSIAPGVSEAGLPLAAMAGPENADEPVVYGKRIFATDLS